MALLRKRVFTVVGEDTGPVETNALFDAGFQVIVQRPRKGARKAWPAGVLRTTEADEPNMSMRSYGQQQAAKHFHTAVDANEEASIGGG